MAIASISGYRSPVDLGLSRVPLTNNPELFDELTQVYNAIHLLNQYLDDLRNIASGEGGGAEQTPDVTAGFSRFIAAIALQDITEGQIISPAIGADGYVKGVLCNGIVSGSPLLTAHVALTSALTGQSVRVGIGPAVIQVPGALPGQKVYGINSRTSTGAYSLQGGTYVPDPTVVSGAFSVPIAVGIATGFAVIGNYVAR